MINLDMLCFECPHCRSFLVDIDFIQDQVQLVCRTCRDVFICRFDGQLWVYSLFGHTEVIR